MSRACQDSCCARLTDLHSELEIDGGRGLRRAAVDRSRGSRTSHNFDAIVGSGGAAVRAVFRRCHSPCGRSGARRLAGDSRVSFGIGGFVAHRDHTDARSDRRSRMAAPTAFHAAGDAIPVSLPDRLGGRSDRHASGRTGTRRFDRNEATWQARVSAGSGGRGSVVRAILLTRGGDPSGDAFPRLRRTSAHTNKIIRIRSYE
jgi:hypothetical protein